MSPSVPSTPNGEEPPPGEPEYLTKAQAAARLHVGRTTLNALLRDNEIDVVRIGRGIVRITPAALRDYTERHTERARANRRRPRGPQGLS